MNRPATALYAAVAITLLIWTVIFIGMYVTMRKPAPAPATATAHEQPQIIPPIDTTETATMQMNTKREGELQHEPAGNRDAGEVGRLPKTHRTQPDTEGQPRTDEASRALAQKAVVVPPKGEADGGAGLLHELPQTVPTDTGGDLHSGVDGGRRPAHAPLSPSRKVPRSVRTAEVARPAGLPAVEASGVAQRLVTDPYARDFMGSAGNWKESEWQAQSGSLPNVASADSKTASAKTSRALASATTADETSTLVPVEASSSTQACQTIAPDYQPACATANSWYAQIAAHYGSAMAHHYDWLRNNAAFVADYNTNGCSPSPCDANFAGRLQPADYAGALGYDSPLGTCTSTTPTKRMRGSNGKGTLPGTLDADGNLHGAVLFNGEYYDGVITDTSCMDCTVTFTHPCQLRNWNEQPAEFIAIDGTRGYTWYLGAVTQ